jgi:hypothetical protein
MMHGKGTFTWDDGRRYEGDYYNDKKHGRGKYSWPDGRVYEGSFVDGLMDGFGMYRAGSGPESKDRLGEWSKGKRVKWIERTFVSYS